MSDDSMQPIAEEAETTAEQFRDPTGPDPEGIPDPMPEDLLADGPTVDPTVDDDGESMDGDAPTG